jgi:hypothetical protein
VQIAGTQGKIAPLPFKPVNVMSRRDEDEKPNSLICLTSAFYRALTLFRQVKPEEARKPAPDAAAEMKPLASLLARGSFDYVAPFVCREVIP